ncbi:hypothetical protein [Prevotella sp.]|nr:hypothetical protein [Prevotella sp.]
MNDIITQINDNFEVLKSILISTVPKMDILKPREWDKIKKHLKDRLSKLDKGEIITSSIFIDYVIHKIYNLKPNDKYERWIDVFNDLVDRVLKDSDETLHNKIEDIIRNLFTTGDNNMFGGNSDFKNRLNELLAIDYFNQCDKVKIIEIEKKLANNKSIDLILRNSSGKTIGVEILTLQNIDPQKQEDDESMSDFIWERIKRKYEDKTKQLTEIKDLEDLLIMPIVEYAEGLEKFNFPTNMQYATHIMCSHLNNNGNKWEMIISNINQYLAMRREGKIDE